MIEVIDQMDRTIRVVSMPKRIISLVPSQTELLHYWGLGNRVVGITKFCIHPEEWYRGKKRVGGTKNINIETIRALKPDLIIGNKEENFQEDIEKLEKEFPVWMSDMVTMNEVWEMMNELGALLGVSIKAKELVERLQNQFSELSFFDNKKISIAYFIWKKPYMVAAKGTFIDTMLALAGFENAFADLERYPIVDEQMLKERNPQAIFLSSEPYPFKEKHLLEMKKLIPGSKVELVDGELFSWYGSRLLHVTDYIKNLRLKLEL